jgi:CheY-like chemotaxis protein
MLSLGCKNILKDVIRSKKTCVFAVSWGTLSAKTRYTAKRRPKPHFAQVVMLRQAKRRTGGYMIETENKNDALTVLLADDHRMILEIFALYLSSSAGMKVDIANDLDGALELMSERGAYDVVLLDLNMPGMNGIAGLRRVIRMNDGKPTGIITSNPTPRMVDELLAAGALQMRSASWTEESAICRWS